MNYLAWVVPRGDWIQEWPSTNAKIVFGLRAAFVYIGTLIGMAVADSIDRLGFNITPAALTCLEYAGWFIGAMVGLAVGQFTAKRFSDPARNAPPTPAGVPAGSVPVTFTAETAVPAVPAPPIAAPITKPPMVVTITPTTDPRDG